MKYTAGQAAKAVGVSTATITRAIKSGRVSALKDEGGAWRIDPSELHRVYQAPVSQASTKETLQRVVIPSESRDLRLDLAVLNERLRAAEVLRAIADERREVAEHDRDAWRAEAQRLTKALPAPPPSPEPPRQRSWWPWR